jgi:hypothetical protein
VRQSVKVHYHCEHCGVAIDTLNIDQLDETELGFDCLTPTERQDIIKIDEKSGAIHVQSLCDSCIEILGLQDPLPVRRERVYIH